MDDNRGQEEYVRQVLEAYRKTPGTMGTVRRPDRILAAQLYQRGVALSVIENALVLAAARFISVPSRSCGTHPDEKGRLFPKRESVRS